MSWRDTLRPVRMERIALVAPEINSRAMLTEVARSARVELDLPHTTGDGIDEVDRAVEAGVVSGPLVGFVGWTATESLAPLAESLAPLGAAVVPLRSPRGVEPPTLLSGNRQRSGASRILVDTYGTVPYADIDPSRIAGLAYMLMFGMMFGDVGHGAILVVAGLILRSGRIARLASLRKIWLFVVGAGLVSMLFGALYGEAFGPTGLVPVLWIEPLSNPVPLLLTGLVIGAGLLAVSYTIGTINRVREGGWGYALYSRTGIAGSLLFVAVGLGTLGIVGGITGVVVTAIVLAVVALAFIFIGLLVDAGGGGTGLIQAVVELMDTIVRLGSNIVSFARLAAFGLTHAALLSVVWSGTVALWTPGWTMIAAVLVFVLGNALTFGLEALVAGIQALRLEYYELFSRIFVREGRPFRPWSPSLPANELDDTSDDSASTRALSAPTQRTSP
ncbi:MAG: hypothetical protein KF761_08465 [Salinibacterium sp.]|nr:hypothetical protein [Salinibacterium sp.]